MTAFAYLTPCFNDCGPYGQCSLLRRHGYLYAGCSCKAGERFFLGSFAILSKGRTLLLGAGGWVGEPGVCRSSLGSQRLPKEPSALGVVSLGAP